LALRADNADQRLTLKGLALGLVGSKRGRAFKTKTQELDDARVLLDGLAATPNELAALGITINMDGVRRSARDLLAYPDISRENLAQLWPQLADLNPLIAEQIEIDSRYSGYLKRQEADVRAFRRDEALAIPDDMDFRALPGLSTEVCSKLELARPATLAAAARISGVTPAALTALLTFVRRQEKKSA